MSSLKHTHSIYSQNFTKKSTHNFWVILLANKQADKHTTGSRNITPVINDGEAKPVYMRNLFSMQTDNAYGDLPSSLLVFLLYRRCAFSNIADVFTQMSLLLADISSFSTCRW